MKCNGIKVQESVRTYSGHLNEKNFVGLAALSESGYIACGSESNSVHVYMKELSKPVVVSKFGKTSDPITVRRYHIYYIG
jgi:hypothetical protein